MSLQDPSVPIPEKYFKFRRNYDEQYASTMFFLDSSYESVQARLLIRFCVCNMDFRRYSRKLWYGQA